MALGGDWDFVPPPWVRTIQIARWARVPAWELHEAPSMWRDRLECVMEAEAHARAMAQRDRQ